MTGLKRDIIVWLVAASLFLLSPAASESHSLENDVNQTRSPAETLATGCWIPLSTLGAPTRMWGHTTVWTGTEMIIWGGLSDQPPYSGEGNRYNPATDSWMPLPTAGAPTGRIGHTAVWTGTEMIVWGGAQNNEPPPSTGGRYRPSTNSWASMSSINAPSRGHTAVWTGSEMIVVGDREGGAATTPSQIHGRQYRALGFIRSAQRFGQGRK